MKASFIDKLIERLERLEPGEVEHYLIELVREKGFLENVFHALQEGVIVLDEAGGIRYLNRAAGVFFALDEEEAIGQRIQEKIPGLDWGEEVAAGQIVSRDLEIFYPDNRFLNFYLSPIDSQGQERLGYVMIVRDITGTKKQTEEKIESERLSALTLLAAGVAHEIGNPLNSLNIHLQLIERKVRKQAPELYDEMEELFSVSKSEIKRLDFIVEQFLRAIRPTRPQLDQVDLNALLRETVKFLSPELHDRKMVIVQELRSDLPPLELDPDQIKQAFYNVIRNASQAMGHGGTLTVHTDLEDDFVTVRFADTGEGISPESMGKIFEPYFTTKPSGSGLGLLIVRRIVREHGGEIKLESRQGQGTVVTIYFPLLHRRIRLLEERSRAARSE